MMDLLNLTPRRRLALKLLWLVMLVFLLVVFSKSEHDFVYQAF
jgi:hypothetical protein